MSAADGTTARGIGASVLRREDARHLDGRGEFALSLAVAVRDPARGYARVVLGAADGPPLVLEATSRLCARGRVDAGAAREAIAADLARAADRQFDTFHRSLHATAALRALTQATQVAP